jgi:hypothetical protein
MAQPSILDVVHAVKQVAPTQPSVAAWWYKPPQRLRLAGALPVADREGAAITIAVEAAPGNQLSEDALTALARALSGHLRAEPVRVRNYQGPDEPHPLFRLLSSSAHRISSEAATT